MKDYQKFISFVVFFTFGFYGLQLVFELPLLSAGTVSLIIYLLFLLWNHSLWKRKGWVFRTIGKLIGLYDYPDISGEWEIEYASSYNFDTDKNEYRTNGKGSATIRQTYSTLHVKGKFENSSSFESFYATLKEKENGDWFIAYGYRSNPNNPKLSNSSGGGLHEGFSLLAVESPEKLEGYYSNDENRRTRGRITLIRKKG